MSNIRLKEYLEKSFLRYKTGLSNDYTILLENLEKKFSNSDNLESVMTESVRKSVNLELKL